MGTTRAGGAAYVGPHLVAGLVFLRKKTTDPARCSDGQPSLMTLCLLPCLLSFLGTGPTPTVLLGRSSSVCGARVTSQRRQAGLW